MIITMIILEKKIVIKIIIIQANYKSIFIYKHFEKLSKNINNYFLLCYYNGQ